jgi:hypothetical protein
LHDHESSKTKEGSAEESNHEYASLEPRHQRPSRPRIVAEEARGENQKAGNAHEALPGRDHTPADRDGTAPKKALFVARLTLRVPSNILRSEKSASDVIKAFDDAVKALLRELVSLMADLRREIFWKRRERRKQLHALKAAVIRPRSQNWLNDSGRR